jgi:hypothetical protein
LSVGYWKIWKPLFELNFGSIRMGMGLPSTALLCVPLVYVILAKRGHSWDWMLRTVVPHIVCILWTDVAVTMWLIGWRHFSIPAVFLTGALISLIVWPTYSAAAIAAGVILSQLKSAIDLITALKGIITVSAFVLPFAAQKVYGKLSKKYNIDVFSASSKRHWILLLVYICTLFMAISFLYQGQSYDVSPEITNMTWAQFDKHCSYSGANIVNRQIQCSQLKDTAIGNWKGTVQSVRISAVDNSFETLLDYLPESIGQMLRCFYDTDHSDSAGLPSGMKPNSCSLTMHNIYTFEMEVTGPYGERYISSNKGQVILVAQHSFKEILQLMEEGDVVQFAAHFDQYPVFTYPPKLRLLQLECVTCKH